MNTMLSKIVGSGLLFLLIFLSGIWLTRTDRPYPVILFTIHKLIALGSVLYYITMVVRVHQVIPLQSDQWLAVVITALCLLATIITGGLVSVEPVMPAFIHKMHQVFPYLTIISLGISLYLLFIRNPLIPNA